MGMNMILLVFLNLLLASLSVGSYDDQRLTTILFGTIGRSSYAFDVYSVPMQSPFQLGPELRLTDGVSVNYNGYFPVTSSESSTLDLIYVSERDGSASIYLDKVSNFEDDVVLEVRDRTRVQLAGWDGRTGLKDRPNLVGEYLVYVSTNENPGVPRKSWNAVYSKHVSSGLTRRLTPYGVADFSPSVSPNGEWTAVASSGAKGWDGEVEDFNTDIYVFKTKDGSFRVKVVDHGGWPCWGDDSTLYYHRKSDDGWWSVYKVTLKRVKDGAVRVNSVATLTQTQRVTPPGVHAFTPAASLSNMSLIALATRRPSSDYRHIELFDLTTSKFVPVTEHVSPYTHHFNPFFSPDTRWIGYHRCRGGKELVTVEPIQSPLPETNVFRVNGLFPVLSPEGDRIAYVNMPGLFVVDIDGSNERRITSEFAFSLAWDPKRKGVLYTNIGPSLANVTAEVHVVSIDIDNPNFKMKTLTTGGKNNAFPSPSPDGKWVVFRSGRGGYKNLYIMDAKNGEKGGLFKLTSGKWTDTMCQWSPDGEWIVFMSNRDNPNSKSFKIYTIRPNGTGIREVVQSGLTGSGLASHPWFSPDSKSIVFTSDLAGVSAEPISNPNQFDPFGEIFTVGIDGSRLTRLTHNAYGDGTPTWASRFKRPHEDVLVASKYGSSCNFEDILWLNKYPNSSKFTFQASCG